jgi:hypothetical protein
MVGVGVAGASVIGVGVAVADGPEVGAAVGAAVSSSSPPQDTAIARTSNSRMESKSLGLDNQ